MEHYDFLTSLSPRFVAFVWRYLGTAHSFALDGRRAVRPASLRLVIRYPLPENVRGDGRISHVPGQPWCLCPALATPADPTHQAIAMRRCGPRYVQNEGVRDKSFEALSHGFGTRCLRFAGWVTPPPRKTRFRPLAKRYRTGLITRGAAAKGFQVTSCSSSSFPKPRGARTAILGVDCSRGRWRHPSIPVPHAALGAAVAKSWPLRQTSASGIHTCTRTPEYLPAVRRDVARVAP
jgi:hypothetical protein